jgi:segregation and condensation protein A
VLFRSVDLDVLADFLLLAATLIRIKTRMLLPRRRVNEQGEGEEAAEEDPRQELVNRLVEYKSFKLLAEALEQRYEGALPRVYFREEQEWEQEVQLRATLAQLVRSFRTVWMQKDDTEPQVKIPEGDIDIHEEIARIEARLNARKRGLTLQDLFAEAVTRREALVIFMALLELVKRRRVRAVQNEPFGPISISMIRSQQDVG